MKLATIEHDLYDAVFSRLAGLPVSLVLHSVGSIFSMEFGPLESFTNPNGNLRRRGQFSLFVADAKWLFTEHSEAFCCDTGHRDEIRKSIGRFMSKTIDAIKLSGKGRRCSLLVHFSDDYAIEVYTEEQAILGNQWCIFEGDKEILGLDLRLGFTAPPRTWETDFIPIDSE